MLCRRIATCRTTKGKLMPNNPMFIFLSHLLVLPHKVSPLFFSLRNTHTGKERPMVGIGTIWGGGTSGSWLIDVIVGQPTSSALALSFIASQQLITIDSSNTRIFFHKYLIKSSTSSLAVSNPMLLHHSTFSTSTLRLASLRLILYSPPPTCTSYPSVSTAVFPDPSCISDVSTTSVMR